MPRGPRCESPPFRPQPRDEADADDGEAPSRDEPVVPHRGVLVGYARLNPEVPACEQEERHGRDAHEREHRPVDALQAEAPEERAPGGVQERGAKRDRRDPARRIRDDHARVRQDSGQEQRGEGNDCHEHACDVPQRSPELDKQAHAGGPEEEPEREIMDAVVGLREVRHLRERPREHCVEARGHHGDHEGVEPGEREGDDDVGREDGRGADRLHEFTQRAQSARPPRRGSGASLCAGGVVGVGWDACAARGLGSARGRRGAAAWSRVAHGSVLAADARCQ